MGSHPRWDGPGVRCEWYPSRSAQCRNSATTMVRRPTNRIPGEMSVVPLCDRCVPLAFGLLSGECSIVPSLVQPGGLEREPA